MAPIEKKRPQKGAGQKARKRQRIALEDGIQEMAGLGPRNLDALPWNEVALPARLDDAEGFFGLEEVSDVEIVRDPNIGKVEYRVGKASQKAAQQPEADLPSYPPPKLQSNHIKSPQRSLGEGTPLLTIVK
jgi:hypothetical protein